MTVSNLTSIFSPYINICAISPYLFVHERVLSRDRLLKLCLLSIEGSSAVGQSWILDLVLLRGQRSLDGNVDLYSPHNLEMQPCCI